MRLLDLFCGRWGWSRAFAARGWQCVGVDINEPSEIPSGCQFREHDVLEIQAGEWLQKFDFIVASSPCEQFSIHGMPQFHPNPKYPAMGIRLFNHTRELCEESGLPYVMENVGPAQWFVGESVNNCGPFHLWGTGVPPLMPQGIRKNMVMGSSKLVNELVRTGDREAIKKYRRQFDLTWNSSKSKERKEATAKAATIPPELANCVADYAERICGERTDASVGRHEAKMKRVFRDHRAADSVGGDRIKEL